MAALEPSMASLLSLSAAKRTDDEVRLQVRQLFLGTGGRPVARERRRAQRVPYPYPVYLTPVGQDGVTPEGENFVVLGKQLSERGLDFYHSEALAHRRVVASLPCGPSQWLGLLLDLSWCRFNRFGMYENGGKFLQVVRSPLAVPEEWAELQSA